MSFACAYSVLTTRMSDAAVCPEGGGVGVQLTSGGMTVSSPALTIARTHGLG
jgi:hypothetical protein